MHDNNPHTLTHSLTQTTPTHLPRTSSIAQRVKTANHNDIHSIPNTDKHTYIHICIHTHTYTQTMYSIVHDKNTNPFSSFADRRSFPPASAVRQRYDVAVHSCCTHTALCALHLGRSARGGRGLGRVFLLLGHAALRGRNTRIRRGSSSSTSSSINWWATLCS